MTVLADYETTVYQAYQISDAERFAPYPREFVIGRDGRILYQSASIHVDELLAAIESGLDP